MTAAARERLLFAALACLAAGARFWGLSSRSLAMDEAVTAAVVERPLARILLDTAENTPPLYYALLRPVRLGLGSSELALRLPSALLGTAAALLTGWVGWMIGGRRLALAALALMALLPLPVVYSQIARAYSLFACASAASFALLLRWEARPGRGRAAAYLAATLTMAYSHHYAAFNLLAQGLYAAWRVRQRRPGPPWVRLFAPAAVGCLPALAIGLRRARILLHDGFWIPRPGLERLAAVLHAQVNYAVHPAASLLYLALAALGIRAAASSAALRERPARALVLLWLACPVLAPFVYSRLATPILWPRYAIAVSPALCLLMAEGALALPGPAAALAALGAVSAFSAASNLQHHRLPREDWRGAAGLVHAEAGPRDLVVVAGYSALGPFTYYYDDRLRGPLEVMMARAVIEEGDAKRVADSFRGLSRRHERLWVVFRHEVGHSGRRTLLDLLGCELPGSLRRRASFAGGLEVLELRAR